MTDVRLHTPEPEPNYDPESDNDKDKDKPKAPPAEDERGPQAPVELPGKSGPPERVLRDALVPRDADHFLARGDAFAHQALAVVAH